MEYREGRNPPGATDRLVLTYTGELSASEGILKGRWPLRSGVLDESGTFEAKKKPRLQTAGLAFGARSFRELWLEEVRHGSSRAQRAS